MNRLLWMEERPSRRLSEFEKEEMGRRVSVCAFERNKTDGCHGVKWMSKDFVGFGIGEGHIGGLVLLDFTGRDRRHGAEMRLLRCGEEVWRA
jgi:hypothetical protein